MATRGTYTIEGKILYNHWDNYPEGAANHFKQVIKKQGQIDYVSLIRGADGTNFVPSTSIYDGPAEFTYKLSRHSDGRIFVMVYAVSLDSENTIFQEETELAEFINKHHKEDKIVFVYRSYMTESAARIYAGDKLRQGIETLLRGWTGNASSYLKEAGIAYLALNDSKVIDGYNKLIAPMLANCYGHGIVDPFLIKSETV